VAYIRPIIRLPIVACRVVAPRRSSQAALRPRLENARCRAPSVAGHGCGCWPSLPRPTHQQTGHV